MNRIKRPMWQFPWQYKESIAFTLGVMLVGALLQITIGSFNFYLIHFPVNLIMGAVLLILIALLSRADKNPIVQWLSGIPLSVCLIGGLLAMGLIMGLTPQYVRVHPHAHLHWAQASWGEILNHLSLRLGFRQVTSSWPFVLLYSLTLLSLGLVIARRLRRFTWRDYGFYLNHFGLWLFLFSAGFGSADMQRHVMYVKEGEVEWRVYDSQQNVLELDIAIKLHDFVMEEYPPRLAIVDKHNGDVQPKRRPAYHQIDPKKPGGTLGDWDIVIEEYIHEAVRKNDTSFQAIPMSGSMPAAKVRVENRKTGMAVSGWVTCGSVDQFVMPLDLDKTYSLVMTKPEAKRFVSDITVIVKDKDAVPLRRNIEVNHPLKIGSWMIYQYDYDQRLGKASDTSGFELVHDPWLYPAYAGILLFALGSLSMLWRGKRKDNTQ